MAKATSSRRRRSTAWHIAAVVILVLLPLLALGGALMPGMIEIEESEQKEADVRNPDYPPLKVKRRPLLIPRDFSTGFVPGIVNYEDLEEGAAARSVLLENIALMSSLGASRGERIILDDLDGFVRSVLFEDVLEVQAIEDHPGGPFDDSLFARIPNPIGYDHGYQFDDLVGARAIVVVPEPTPGQLALLGLGAIAATRRMRG